MRSADQQSFTFSFFSSHHHPPRPAMIGGVATAVAVARSSMMPMHTTIFICLHHLRAALVFFLLSAMPPIFRGRGNLLRKVGERILWMSDHLGTILHPAPDGLLSQEQHQAKIKMVKKQKRCCFSLDDGAYFPRLCRRYLSVVVFFPICTTSPY